MATNEEGFSSAKTANDINILLLGETGVGKSTFINSFLNSLRFDSFEDACQKYQHIHCPIPTKFTIIDDQLNERIIQEGSNDNESNVAGDSATLGTKSYVLHIPKYNRRLRLIDTPGIADTRGILQDDKNQRNTINYLSSIDYINAICVLLKPNQARCTIQFRYCINQLLLYLHKTAVDNIMFVFTHTRSTFFAPGETIHPLRETLKEIEERQNIKMMISKENSFSIDNESFRYLLVRKHNILLGLGDKKIFSDSFAHTRTEFLRLLEFAANAQPYDINKTLYLYKTREKFEDVCNSLTKTLNLLKSDSTRLKKLHSADSGSNIDIEDMNRQVQDIEGKLSKYESEKHHLNLQISKFLTYLRADSIVLFNRYCQEYVNYLIDREMSMGVTSDKTCIRDYRILISYYEDIERIINSNIHMDEASPVLTREELSSAFPGLEEDIVNNSRFENEVLLDEIQTSEERIINSNIHMDEASPVLTLEELLTTFPGLEEDSVYNSRYENEVLLDEIQTSDVEEQDDSDTESVSDPFTFIEFYDLIKESADDHNKRSIGQKLKKTNIKPEHSSVNMNPSCTDNRHGKKLYNNHRVPFKKQPDHLNKHLNNNFAKILNETPSASRGFPSQRNHNRGMKANFRGNSSTILGQPCVGHNKSHQNKNEGAFRGGSRGRGGNRGRGRGHGDNHQTYKKEKQSNANFNKQFDAKVVSHENKPKCGGTRKPADAEVKSGRGHGDNHQTYKKEKQSNANFNKQFDAKVVSHENKPKSGGTRKPADAEVKSPPKNMFQSMQNIFD